MTKSKGMYEAEISKAITQWEKIFLTWFVVSKDRYSTRYDYRQLTRYFDACGVSCM